MEGNFETSGGGASGGSSMPDPGGFAQIESSGGFGSMNSNNAPDSNSGWLNYLQDGVDKGIYKAETEGVFSLDEVMSDAQAEMSEADEKQDWDIMKIPGATHEKLSGLAEMSDEDINQLEQNEVVELYSEAEENTDKSVKERSAEKLENKEYQPSFEEQIIKLQAEAIKLMAEGMNSKVKEKDLEELMRKLRKLLEEIGQEKEKGSNKTNLLLGVFAAVTLLLKMGREL